HGPQRLRPVGDDGRVQAGREDGVLGSVPGVRRRSGLGGEAAAGVRRHQHRAPRGRPQELARQPEELGLPARGARLVLRAAGARARRRGQASSRRGHPRLLVVDAARGRARAERGLAHRLPARHPRPGREGGQVRGAALPRPLRPRARGRGLLAVSAPSAAPAARRGLLAEVARFLPGKRDYDLKHLRSDVLAGVTVAFVALPLALGFGVTSGAGASAGTVTAIVAGLVAAAFGGSRFRATGPAGAMTAILLGSVAHHGPGALPLLCVGAGLILVALGLLRIGSYVRFVPWPVVTGFTNGIAVIIFLQQLPAVLGVSQEPAESILLLARRTVAAWLEAPTFMPLVLAA